MPPAGNPGANNHAALARKSLLTRSGHSQQLFHHLQRAHGNRYVQRIVELSRKGSDPAEVDQDIEETIQSKRGGGRAMDGVVRQHMESGFGRDFSNVRIHTDSDADSLNKNLNARAFTTGSDVFFRGGEYRPGSSSGRELLAHELTHVVQQGGSQLRRQSEEDEGEPIEDIESGIQTKLTLGQPDDKYEQEADVVARKVMQNENHSSSHSQSNLTLAQKMPLEDEEEPVQAKTNIQKQEIEEKEETIPALAVDTDSSASGEKLHQKNEKSIESDSFDKLLRKATNYELETKSDVGLVPSQRKRKEDKLDESTEFSAPSLETLNKKKIQRVSNDQESQATPNVPSEDEIMPEVPQPERPIKQQTENRAQEVSSASDTGPPPQAINVDPTSIVQAAPEETSTVAGGVPPDMTQTESTQPQVETEMIGYTEEFAAAGFSPDQEVVEHTVEDFLVSNDLGANASSLIGEAQGYADSLQAHAEQRLSALEAYIGQQAALAQANANQAHAEIDANYSVQQNNLNTQAETALAGISADVTARKATLSAFAQAERGRLQNTFQMERETATSGIAALKVETSTTANAEAQRAITGSDERVQIVQAQAQAVATTGEPESVKSQRKAVQKIVQHTTKQLRQTGQDAAQQVRQELPQHLAGYDDLLQQYLQQIATTQSESQAPLGQFVSTAQQRLGSDARDATTLINQVRTQSLSGLAAQRDAAHQGISAWESQTVATVQAADQQLSQPVMAQTMALKNALLEGGANAASQVAALPHDETDAAVTESSAQLAEGYEQGLNALDQWETETISGLAETIAQLNADLGSITSERNTALADIGTQMTQTLQKVEEKTLTELETTQSSFETQFSTSVNEGIEQLNQAGSKFRERTNTLHQDSIGSYVQIVDNALNAEDQLVSQASSKMASAVGQIASKYSQLKEEANQRNRQGADHANPQIQRSWLGDAWNAVTGWLESVRQWFVNNLGEFWGNLLFSLISTLVVVVVGIVAIVLIAKASVVAAVVVVVGLLVVGIGMGIYMRFQEFYADNQGQDAGVWRGIGLVLLGIADITGIPYLIEAAVGQRAFGKELTPGERGARVGTGIVMLATLIFAAVKGVRAWRISRAQGRGRGSSAPVEEPGAPRGTTEEPAAPRGTPDDVPARPAGPPRQLDNNMLSAFQDPQHPNHAVAAEFMNANRGAELRINRAVYQEYLANSSKDQFRQLRAQLLNDYNIRLRLARAASLEQIIQLAGRIERAFQGTGRSISSKDARVAAGARLSGERLVTRDLQFYKRARDLGLDVEFVGTGRAAERAAAYQPQPVTISEN
ncbi:DUF4157 domain-containing protein [Nitrosomonas sp.]|uniref:eCIS core domain-containing protein n=1 Tax=Nitrosomonas sp. TaxID=42353 RepID=UPI0025FDF482|nr:DUF4157 domain-containing protein [Nitrosomonas sp.]